MKDSANGAEPGEFIGDFHNGTFDLGWDCFDEEMKVTKHAVELNQGHATQMGLLGLMVHDQLGNVETYSLPLKLNSKFPYRFQAPCRPNGFVGPYGPRPAWQHFPSIKLSSKLPYRFQAPFPWKVEIWS